MIIDGQFWVGVGLLALLTLSPGATTALVVSVAAAHGRAAAFVTSLGSAAGILVYASATGLGLSVVLAASPEAFTAVKIAGALYLTYLGIRAIARSGGGRTVSRVAPSGRDFFARGLLTNLLNPQIALFYLTFLPQFISPSEPVLLKAVLFGAIHACIVVAWFAVYSYGINALASRVQAARPWIERVSGLLLIGFAVRLLLVSR